MLAKIFDDLALSVRFLAVVQHKSHCAVVRDILKNMHQPVRIAGFQIVHFPDFNETALAEKRKRIDGKAKFNRVRLRVFEDAALKPVRVFFTAGILSPSFGTIQGDLHLSGCFKGNRNSGIDRQFSGLDKGSRCGIFFSC